jgi:lambda family phage tail tape measure protein
MDAILEQAEQQKKLVRALIAERQAAERDWLLGAKRGFAEYEDAATNAAQNTHDFVSHSLSSMEDAFVQWARTGKLASRDLADAIIADFIRLSTRQNITGPLAGYLGSLNLGALFTGSGYGAGASGAGAFDYTDAAGQVFPEFAEGGVMTSRGPLPLKRYAGGGIADSPQLAMFGEGSSPEAYVPLPDGRRIPVQMSGQSGQSGHTFIIDARGADRTGLAQLQALITRLDGSVEYRAVAAVRRAAAQRGRSAAF